ncbi:MAG: M48 family metallopeptidase [Bradymonadaceae bacterium]
MDFDFLEYVDREREPQSGRDAATGFGEYAFSGDIRVLRRIQKATPVRVVAQSAVRFWRSMEKNELLGTSVKVTRRQFPELYDRLVDCADQLDVAPPTVYVSRDAELNAGTYGTETEAFIVLNSGLVESFEGPELSFVLGHECGHLQNNHVVYQTAAQFLAQGVASFVRWAVAPAQVALNSWSRRGEITCDRAGLLCCGDLDVALDSMLKLAVGGKQLFDSIDMDEYMEQLEDLQEGVGRFKELLQEHPYLPKRIRALRLFAESSYYLNEIGESGGRPLDEIDREIEEIVKVV